MIASHPTAVASWPLTCPNCGASEVHQILRLPQQTVEVPRVQVLDMGRGNIVLGPVWQSPSFQYVPAGFKCGLCQTTIRGQDKLPALTPDQVRKIWCNESPIQRSESAEIIRLEIMSRRQSDEITTRFNITRDDGCPSLSADDLLVLLESSRKVRDTIKELYNIREIDDDNGGDYDNE